MKRLNIKMLLVLTITLIASFAFAQIWHPTNQVTMAWDAANNATSYKVYIKSVDGSNITEVGTTALLIHTITFAQEGRYFLGVQSVREVDGETFTSDISWSDNPDACLNAATFGAVYYIPPEAAVGLRIE